MISNLFHITDLSNLSSILENKGLISLNELKRKDITFSSIAYQSLQDRRAFTRVPRGPGGRLHDYIPFFFCTRPPMLYVISKGYVNGCPEGQSTIIYIVTNTGNITNNGLEFVFTDGHAIMALSRFYVDLKDLDQIDWEIMRAKYWRDTLKDMDRKRRRQAEFLVYRFLPWDLVDQIVVVDKKAHEKVDFILKEHNLTAGINISPSWYY